MGAKIRFANPIPFVKDIQVSTQFYRDVLGLKVLEDAQAFVLFEDHFSIHQAREILDTVFGEAPGSDPQTQGRDNLLLYFETDDLDEMFARVKNHVTLIHPIVQQAWGQRVFRFYDPDCHIVEIGEPSVYTFEE
ncbi:MAG: VOC family protein [Anaerolineaceae bacterium]|nr:VOC family protein [Anaerolineaceae bacterium]